MRPVRAAAGYTLLEMLIVVAVIMVLTALMLPRTETELSGQLQAMAETIAGDMEYARSLAVANSDTYQITFNPTGNSYVLQYSGSNNALKTLPQVPFRQAGDLPTQQTTSLADLPNLGPQVTLLAVGANSQNGCSPTTVLIFGPLGQITQGQDVVIWLSAGMGSKKCYLPLTVNHVTGLCTLGTYSGSGPPASLLGH